jgi:thymidylate kinase
MKRLFIFEGPDGVGKTTIAKALARHIDALYGHYGAFPGDVDIAWIYEDAMKPATKDVADVVMDRSWLSEIPYAIAFRGGVDRLGAEFYRLEDIALKKTIPLVIRCDADWATVTINFRRRKQEEYLQNINQLHQVWTWYRESFMTSLPQLLIHPFTISTDEAVDKILTWNG